ncbi:LysR family transcriptional regulator [Actinoplanes cyaneus]|uniref:LysR family transcriptional regulator n=1 Tax=Actinoplanes cyaneus TaxID=52696 RepID=A0A919IME3_9ACTN|nr:LysR family transcriptional regulator [Actinoplanes cyaneus]MCW2138114.1 LysR substrate binding domain-containing protein [Actinoplanes cyaneus]GID64675.1 LysR family transcriptional regulator [Actinoplanes cyaneus]
MLERHELEAFLTLAEELHFGRTAARLHVTPTRVSQTIRKLERRIGAPLFDRTSRRVVLTPIGRILLDEVRPAWAGVTAGVQRAIGAAHGGTGTLTAGFVSAGGSQLLTRIADHFRTRRPGWEVELREARLGGGAEAVREMGLDVLLAPYPVAGAGLVAGGVLIREARWWAVPADAADVAGLPRVPAGGTTISEVLTRVGAGHGVFAVGSHVRRYYARPDVAYLPGEYGETVEWGLAWRGDAPAGVPAFNQAALDLLGRSVPDGPGAAGAWRELDAG